MPYSIIESDGRLTVTVSGAITGAELHQLVDESEALLKGRAQWPDNLLDLRTVSLSGLGITDMMGFAGRLQSVLPPHPMRTAFVAEPSVASYLRMLKSMAQNALVTLEVFPTLAEAEAWLATPRA